MRVSEWASVRVCGCGRWVDNACCLVPSANVYSYIGCAVCVVNGASWLAGVHVCG